MVVWCIGFHNNLVVATSSMTNMVLYKITLTGISIIFLVHYRCNHGNGDSSQGGVPAQPFTEEQTSGVEEGNPSRGRYHEGRCIKSDIYQQGGREGAITGM